MTKQNKNLCQYTAERLQQLVHKICHFRQISLYHFKYGPRKYTQHQFVALLILYARSNKSLRRFIAWLYESKWPEWLGLKEIPCKSSLHNHFVRIGLPIIRLLNRFTVKEEESLRLAIDSTGIEAYRASKHYEKRIGRYVRDYLKLSILAQVEKPYLVEDFACARSKISDVRQAKPFTRHVKKGTTVFADKAYDCNWLMEMFEEKGAELYCPIRKSSRKRPKGRLRRKQKDNFDKDFYHKGRNPVEMIMFLLKHKGLVIRAKKVRNQIKEMAWKIVAYNLERLAEAIQIMRSIIRLWTRPFNQNIKNTSFFFLCISLYGPIV